MAGLQVLAVDDEPPALDELVYLLRADNRVADVRSASDAVSALTILDHADLDAIFLDIRMPGMDGLGLARVLGRFARPPQIVFVTAYEEAALDAFAVGAVDYLLKPLRQDRLAEAIRRVQQGRSDGDPPEEVTIAVELGGVTRFIALSDVRYVEAHGDYARLHTPTDSHLLRVAMGTLEERWASAGFVRVHRSYLVSTSHIAELRLEDGGFVVRVSVGQHSATLPVSRRHARALKDRLVGRAGRDWDPT